MQSKLVGTGANALTASMHGLVIYGETNNQDIRRLLYANQAWTKPPNKSHSFCCFEVANTREGEPEASNKPNQVFGAQCSASVKAH